MRILIQKILYVIVAFGLNKRIRNKSPILPKYQDQLVRYIRTTVKCLFEGLALKEIKWKDFTHIGMFAKIYAMVEDFHAEEKTWESLNEHLKKNLTSKELEDFIKRKDEEKQNLHKY